MSNTTTNNSPTGETSKALIYVVDDEPMLLELASVILEPQGYVLKTFRDPTQALQCFRAERPSPDLLITDYAMHSMNGMQLIEQVRRTEPRQKVLLISGTVGEDIFDTAAERPDHFLAKPYLAGQLIASVKELIEAK